MEKREGYVGKPKGSKQVLWERGWYVDGMSTTARDAEKNMEQVLGGLPDLKNDRTALQHTVEKRGHTFWCCRPSFTQRWPAWESLSLIHI